MFTFAFTRFARVSNLGRIPFPYSLSLKHATGVLRRFEPSFKFPVPFIHPKLAKNVFNVHSWNWKRMNVSNPFRRMYSMHDLRFVPADALWFQQVLDQVKSTEELVRKGMYGR